MMFGQMAENFMLVTLSNLQPNLWEVDLKTVPLVQGSATYTVPAETVTILDLYISYGNPPTDRYLNQISRTEFAAIPNKTQQAFPNQFWFDRLISPTITFWPVPDSGGPYVAKYYSVRQTQDAVLANGLTVEVPYRFLEVFTSGVAWKLAEKYAPQMCQEKMMYYDRALKEAQTQDTENVSMYIIPALGGYYRP
jgi:hypothetical protein